MPVNTNSVAALVKSLLAAPASPLDDMRIDAFYTGNFVDPAHNFAAWGILPIGGFADGDIAALRPVQGKPIAAWPVLRFSHVGDPGRHFASSIHTWLPAHVIEYETENEDLAGMAKDLAKLGAYLGDKGRTGKILDAIRENDLPSGDAALCELAEGKDSLLCQYHSMNGNAAELKSLLKKFPDFADARYQLFDADGIPEGKATLAAAWDILCLDILMDGSYKRVREIAQYLVGQGKKAYADDPRLKAVEAMAAKALCGDAWFKAAEELESKKKHRDAYLAYRNAAYWIHVETGTALDATWLGGKRAAAAIGDKNLLSLFAPFKVTQSKDFIRVLGKYTEYSERKAKAADTQKLLAPFFAAARKGDVAKLESLIASGIAINARDTEKGFTALHFAAQAGKLAALAPKQKKYSIPDTVYAGRCAAHSPRLAHRDSSLRSTDRCRRETRRFCHTRACPAFHCRVSLNQSRRHNPPPPYIRALYSAWCPVDQTPDPERGRNFLQSGKFFPRNCQGRTGRDPQSGVYARCGHAPRVPGGDQNRRQTTAPASLSRVSRG